MPALALSTVEVFAGMTEKVETAKRMARMRQNESREQAAMSR